MIKKILASNPKSGDNNLAVLPLPTRLPQKMPKLKSGSKVVKVTQNLDSRLRDYHKDRTNDAPFAQPPRILATAAIFSSADFLGEPSVPDEARLRSYYDRNQLDFIKSVTDKNTKDGKSIGWF